MRIFHIITHLNVGGAERIAINLAKSNDIEGHIVEICRGEGIYSNSLLKECLESGIIVHRAPVRSTKLGIILFPFRMLNLAIKWNPDVVHTHTEIPDLAVLLYFKSFGFFSKAKIVRTIHNTRLWTGWKHLGRKAEKFYIKRRANVSIGDSVSESYINNYHSQPDYLVYNGVQEIKQVSFDNCLPNKINILFAGRLEPYKGIKTLIAIVTHFANDERFFFHIAGSGSMREELVKSVSKLGNNQIYDSIPQLAAKMSSFDFMLLPSEFEGLSITSIESSISGCPVIANSCAGLKDTLPEDWPLKVKDNSLQDYITLIDSLPQTDREALGRIAHTFAAEHFSIDAMQKKYEELYRRQCSFL